MLAGHGVDRATSVPDSPSGPNAAATLRSGTDVCLDVNESGSRRICGRFLGFAQTGSGGFAGLLLLVETPDNIELVDATHVQQVFLPGPQYGWAYGGAVGLALDAALILAASQMNFGSDGAGWQF
jgi:hypothetical protein